MHVTVTIELFIYSTNRDTCLELRYAVDMWAYVI